VKNLKLKIGRQQISYRDNRVFGPGNWGNTGRYVWDAAVLSFSSEYFNSDFIVGKPVLHNPNIWPNKFLNEEVMTSYALYNKMNLLPFELDVFYVLKKDNRGLTQGEKYAGDLTSHTIGFWLNGEIASWNYGGMLTGQFGKSGSDKINAGGLVLWLGHQFQTGWNPNIELQYIYGSGDKNPYDGINNTFDGIFSGSDTKLYGWMNLFFWKNMNEYRTNITLTPFDGFTFRSEYHYFTLSEPKDAWYFPGNAQRREKEGKSGIELGHEFDFTVRIKTLSYLEILSGYCFFIPGEFVKNTGDGPVANWYFLETTFYF